jgi:hypothetical protein
MKHVLSPLGNIPVASSVIASLYPDISGKNQKISQLEKANEIIRLKRGLFVVSPEISELQLSTELIANHLYAPSYVSMSSALRYYGLIPEAVYMNQNMTIKHSRTFETPVGHFSYLCVPRDVFPIGLTNIIKNGFSFIIATPEKALCDLIANSPKVNLRYPNEVRQYLEDDIRLDMDAFYRMNPEIFREYIGVGKKSSSISTIIKLLEKEQ